MIAIRVRGSSPLIRVYLCNACQVANRRVGCSRTPHAGPIGNFEAKRENLTADSHYGELIHD